MILSDLLAPTYVQMLGALSAWLDRAEAQLSSAAADRLLSASLADDMFPLSTQIRFACVQAQEGMFRITASALPDALTSLLDEGRKAAERPGSIDDARRRIAETIAVVRSIAAGKGPADPASRLAHALPNGMIFDLTMESYARDWALPQFYFHVNAAYAILRAQGIELGKADYVRHMFAYLRPGTEPAPDAA